LDHPSPGQDKHVRCALAENGTILRILDRADLFPRLALVSRGDQAAVRQPVQGFRVPPRQCLGTVPPDRAVSAAWLESFTAVRSAQQVRLRRLLAWGRGDDCGPAVEYPAGAVALASRDE